MQCVMDVKNRGKYKRNGGMKDEMRGFRGRLSLEFLLEL